MQVRLLGPVDVVAGGRAQVVGGLRRAGVLAVLALAAGEVVSAGDLAGAVWGGEPPASNSLQSHISALRGVLGRDAIVARPPGYVLDLGPDGTDVQAARRLLSQAVITSRQQLTSLAITADARPLTLDLMTAAEARDLLTARLGAGSSTTTCTAPAPPRC